MMTDKQPVSANLNDIVVQIRALRRVTKDTGFLTSRSQGKLLASLSIDELVEVGRLLEQNDDK